MHFLCKHQTQLVLGGEHQPVYNFSIRTGEESLEQLFAGHLAHGKGKARENEQMGKGKMEMHISATKSCCCFMAIPFQLILLYTWISVWVFVSSGG